MYSRGPQDHSRESMGVKCGGQKDSPPHFREGEYCVPIVAGPEGFEPPTYRLEGGLASLPPVSPSEQNCRSGQGFSERT